MRILLKALFLIAATLRGALAQEPQHLLVVPSRLVMAGGARSGEIILSNQGTAPATFDVAFRHFDMAADGRLVERDLAPDPDLQLLVVAPSSARLAPGESQVFRLMVKNSVELPMGETLIHLAFQARAETPGPSPPGSGVPILQGISVPVIIRHGTTPARISIRDFAFQGGRVPAVTMKLCREGDQSVFGDLLLVAEQASGATRPLASRQGIAVYASLPSRALDIPLGDGGVQPGERLRALFVARDQDARAEATLDLR
ncbi:MAG TPA: hypothetical protein VJ600_04780 [Holophagaceae bacterium]|nr:hypothetical protein [Holophagaceae bacterium]